jgi:hypothetical protein
VYGSIQTPWRICSVHMLKLRGMPEEENVTRRVSAHEPNWRVPSVMHLRARSPLRNQRCSSRRTSERRSASRYALHSRINPFSLHHFRVGLLHICGESESLIPEVSRAEDKQQQPHALPIVKTERVGVVVTLMTRVLAGAKFEPRAGHGVYCLTSSQCSSIAPGKFQDSPRLDHKSFLPNPSEFTIHLRFYYSTLLGKVAYIVQNFQFLIYYEEIFSFLFPMQTE